MATTIEYDLKDILSKEFGDLKAQFNQRFDKVEQEIKEIKGEIKEFRQELKDIKGDIQEVKEGQIRLEGEISTIKVEISNVQKNISRLETSQNAQLWTLIITVIGAIITTVVKFSFFPNT